MNDSNKHISNPLRTPYLVEVREKRFLNSTEIYIPFQPYIKSEEGYEPNKKQQALQITKEGVTPISISEEERNERSVRRAKVCIRELALCNEYELFITFTFKSDRFDNEKTRRQFMNWLKRQKKVYKDFKYIAVAEFHKRCEECVEYGVLECKHDEAVKAIHFHAMVGGYGGELLLAYDENGHPRKRKGKLVYNLKSYTLGFTTAQKIGSSEKDLMDATHYLMKYISKDLKSVKNRKRYWSSKGLKRAETILNPDGWYLSEVPIKTVPCKYGIFYYFDNKKIRNVEE